MAAFGDLADFLDEAMDEPVRLPIRGKTYEFKSSIEDIPIAVGLRIMQYRAEMEQAVKDAKDGKQPSADLTAERQDAIAVDLITPDVYEQMVADGVTPREREHVASTLLLHYLYGSDFAMQCWTGTLDKAGESLGETLGLTGNSSTRTAPTGSTPTSTSTPAPDAAASLRGGQSSKRGRSSKRTSTSTTGRTFKR